jgi:hypothetical protein
MIAEALDDTIERRSWFDVQQVAEPPGDADIARWKHVEASEASQQHHAGCPRADARQLGEGSERIARAHA